MGVAADFLKIALERKGGVFFFAGMIAALAYVGSFSGNWSARIVKSAVLEKLISDTAEVAKENQTAIEQNSKAIFDMDKTLSIHIAQTEPRILELLNELNKRLDKLSNELREERLNK